MSSTTGASAAARPQRGGSNAVVESNKGVRAAAKRFRQCFPSVQNKKIKGWRAKPDVGYTLCNVLRKRHNESITRDDRVAGNALSHRATANEVAMATDAGAAAAAVPADTAIRLFKPSEILAADAAGYPADQPTKLITVTSEEAAQYFIRQEGYRRFDLHTTYQTVPQAPAPPAPGAGGPVYLLPPPEGEVAALPPKMPKLYEPKDGEPPRRSPNPVSFEGFIGVYGLFDQMMTSSTKLPYVV